MGLRRIILALTLALLAVGAWAQQSDVVSKITVEGQKNISQEAILAAMNTKVGERFSRDVLAQDKDAIDNLGFFRDVQILSGLPSGGNIEVLVRVSEYPVVKEVRVVGATVLPVEKVTAIVTGVQPLGQVFNLRNVGPISTALAKAYEQKGYYVQVGDIAPQDDSAGTLLVSILEPKVNEIALTGLGRTRPSVIRRMMKTKPGMALSDTVLRKDMEELYYTYWFEKIDPTRVPAEKPGYFNIGIDFQETRTAQISAGVALDPQSRLVGTVNYNDTNFMGLGQSVGLSLSQATVGGGVSAELAYGNRYMDSKDTAMQLRLYSKVVYNFTGSGFGPFETSEDEDRFDERRTGIGLTFTRPFAPRFRASVGLSAQRSETIQLNAADTAVDYIQQDGDLGTLLFGMDYDTRQPSNEPYQGQLARLVVEPGMCDIRKIGGNVAGIEDLLGKHNFLRTSLEYRRYWSRPLPPKTPIDKPRPVLAFRSRLGYISGTTPFFEQLFVGGSDSLRGYPNQRFWGDRSWLSSLEYRYPIQKAFNVVGFVDYGGAWGGYGNLNNYSQSDDMDLRLGYGVGVAFRTPLGPIRIDFGFSQDGESRTHFSFGTSF